MSVPNPVGIVLDPQAVELAATVERAVWEYSHRTYSADASALARRWSDALTALQVYFEEHYPNPEAAAQQWQWASHAGHRHASGEDYPEACDCIGCTAKLI